MQSINNVAAEMAAASNLDAGAIANFGTLKMKSHYKVECFDADGNLKWVEEVDNLVTNAGLNDLLDKYFKGSSYTGAFYVGLKDTGTAAAGDTLASHSGWTEDANYSGNRKALTLGSVSGQSVDNSASKAAFAISGTTTIYGAFLCTAASGTSGTLYGVADFGTARSVLADDTLNVTVTLTAATA